MSKILAFDTSADFCAAAIVCHGKPLAARSVAMSRGHAEALVPLVQCMCADVQLELGDLDLIGVTVGPGSFTGVRTGLAAAKGFALAAGCPTIGVSTMEAVAAACRNTRAAPLLVILETRREDYFVQVFDAQGQPEDPPAVRDAAQILEIVQVRRPVVAGNAVDRFRRTFEGCLPGDAVFEAGPGVPNPDDIAYMAHKIL